MSWDHRGQHSNNNNVEFAYYTACENAHARCDETTKKGRGASKAKPKGIKWVSEHNMYVLYKNKIKTA